MRAASFLAARPLGVEGKKAAVEVEAGKMRVHAEKIHKARVPVGPGQMGKALGPGDMESGRLEMQDGQGFGAQPGSEVHAPEAEVRAVPQVRTEAVLEPRPVEVDRRKVALGRRSMRAQAQTLPAPFMCVGSRALETRAGPGRHVGLRQVEMFGVRAENPAAQTTPPRGSEMPRHPLPAPRAVEVGRPKVAVETGTVRAQAEDLSALASLLLGPRTLGAQGTRPAVSVT